MRNFFRALFIGGCFALMGATVTLGQTPQDKMAAEKSAEDIVAALGSRNYKVIWDQMTSQWFKSRVPEDAFIANLTMGRQVLGTSRGSTLISTEYGTQDPSGYQGPIYAMMFRSKYSSSDVFERIVMIKDQDGKFRMSGLNATPAPPAN
jgi:hypothetical protein